MPYLTDTQLNTLAAEKNESGCRDALKKMASHVERNAWQDMPAVLQRAEKLGLMQDRTVVMVTINQILLFFYDKTVEEVRTLIESAEPKKTMPVAPKILAQMSALRLKRYLGNLEEVNKYLKEDFDRQMVHWNEAQKIGGVAPSGFVLVKPVLKWVDVPEEVRTVADFKARCETLVAAKTYSDFTRIYKSWKKEFFSKPELTDQHISDGWNIVIAGQVMES